MNTALRVPHVEQQLFTLPEHLSSPKFTHGFQRDLCCSIFSFVSVLFVLFAFFSLFFWPLHCLPFLDLQLLVTPLVSFGHCIVYPSLIYSFWLPLWYLLAIALSTLPWFTASDYPFGILWPLHCLPFLDLQLLITPLVSSNFSSRHLIMTFFLLEILL